MQRKMKLPFRNHRSKKLFDLDFDQKYWNITTKLPNGFWYSFKDSSYERDYSLGEWVYEIKLKNLKKILRITSLSDLLRFERKYKITVRGKFMISWDEVSKDYSGVEFRNYKKILNSIRKKRDWFSEIGYDSGCIWDLSVIKEFELFAELTYDQNYDLFYSKH